MTVAVGREGSRATQVNAHGHPQPWFGPRDSDSGIERPARRLLLVSYHFPPDTAVGGLRWQQFSRFLAEHGWGVDVVSRDLDAVHPRDDRRLELLPADLRIFCASERELYITRAERAAARLIRRLIPRRKQYPTVALSAHEIDRASDRRLVRAYNAWARIETEKAWGRSATRIGSALSRPRPYDAVASSGPPHMVHEAARRIAKATRTPLMIDLRDPWSAVERVAEDHASPVWFSIARRFERLAVRDARLIVMNTEMARDDMHERYPAAINRIVAVPNGSDDDPIPAVEPTARFSIRFAGSIYLDRDPRLLFRAAAIVVRRLGLTPADFGFEFIGHVDEFGGTSVRGMAAEEGLAGFVDVDGPRPRDAAMRFLASATMLLNLPQGADMCVPAKLFEYVRFNAWLLVLAKNTSATAQMLRDTGADVVDPNDVDRIAEVIETRYLQHARGERPVAAGRDGRFERKRQAERLLHYMETLVVSR